MLQFSIRATPAPLQISPPELHESSHRMVLTSLGVPPKLYRAPPSSCAVLPVNEQLVTTGSLKTYTYIAPPSSSAVLPVKVQLVSVGQAKS